MTLEDAIKHCYEVYNRLKAQDIEDCECAEEHKQLAEWLKELKKRQDQDQQDWIPCDEKTPNDERLVIVSVCGSDIIALQENESLEKALERIWKTHRYTGIAYYYYDESEQEHYWCQEGYPMIIQPVAWRELPFATPYDPEKRTGGKQ